MSAAFTAIERVLGSVLAFFFDLVPSFGTAIILLTVAINLVLFPLTLKQTRSTRAFQTIQPEIRRLQKEHKDSPETMQRELMRVQREAGATPGGCLLPMLVQFPIWLALFRVLRNVSDIASGGSVAPLIPANSALLTAVEAGRTRFLGMSLGTPISEGILSGVVNALPYAFMLILMVASQYIQQWHATRGQATQDLTPQQRQQQQTSQMITRIMPLFIGFVSWNFPAGLVLYWTTSNIFRLGQQVVIFRMDGRPQPVVADRSGPGADTKGRNPEQAKPAGGPAPGPGATGSGDSPGKKPQAMSERKRRRRRK